MVVQELLVDHGTTPDCCKDCRPANARAFVSRGAREDKLLKHQSYVSTPDAIWWSVDPILAASHRIQDRHP